MCVVNAIPSGSRSIRKGNVLTAPSLLDESSYFLSVKGDMIEFVPINQLRLLLKPNGKINIQAFWGFSGCKLRALRYRCLNRIVYTNDKLFALKIVYSLYCTFCKTEMEFPEHLFFFCKIVFWKEVLLWKARYSNDVKYISVPDVFLWQIQYLHVKILW